MKFGSVFSGIGGFEIGLERAGWECAWQIENDKFCNRVLGKGWPSVKRFGDIRGVRGSDLGSVDLMVGGFPCQDLSIAGKRAGIMAERSGLFFEFARLAGELRPEWLLVENVHGLLSSREGEDFYVLLQTLAELGYGVAWRTLDSRYFGVPQRRRRVFIVGHLGGPVPHEVLFDGEGGGGDPAPGDTPGSGAADCIGGRTSHALRGGTRGSDDPFRQTYIPTEARLVNATYGKHDDDVDTLVTVTGKAYSHALTGGRSGGFDASEDGTGRGTPIVATPPVHIARRFTYAVRTAQTGANGIGVAEDETHTLDSANGQAIAQTLTKSYGKQVDSSDRNGGPPNIVIDWQSGGDSRGLDPTYDETRALHRGQTPAVYTTKLHNTKSNQAGKFYENYSPSLQMNSPAPAVLRMREGKAGGGKGPLIREDESLTLATSNDQTLFQPIGFATSGLDTPRDDGQVPPVKLNRNGQNTGSGASVFAVTAPATVRRLTPTECERLQGFPDGWTCFCGCEPYSTENCRCPDGPRYAALGNAVTTNVVEWIGQRLAAYCEDQEEGVAA